MTDAEYTPEESAEGWALVDMMQNIIANVRDSPHFTAEEHALMGAGEIQRDWLTVHDARVRRDAAREALDGLIAWHRENAQDTETPAPIRRGVAVMADEAQRYRDTEHPEETP